MPTICCLPPYAGGGWVLHSPPPHRYIFLWLCIFKIKRYQVTRVHNLFEFCVHPHTSHPCTLHRFTCSFMCNEVVGGASHQPFGSKKDLMQLLALWLLHTVTLLRCTTFAILEFIRWVKRYGVQKRCMWNGITCFTPFHMHRRCKRSSGCTAEDRRGPQVIRAA